MIYLLDTDFLSLFSKKRIPTAAERWFAGHEADCRISIVTWAELHFGVQAAAEADRPALAAWLETVETAFQTATLPLGLPELTRWKVLLADLKSKNRTLSCEDTLIAATALHHGCQVVTLNQRHFLPTGVKVLTPV